MIAVLQRTSNASVSVKDKIIGQIKDGVVVLLGVKRGDSFKESEYLAQKVSKLRIFNDKQNKIVEYKNAYLRIYDKPVLYFPYFYHPDPTVKRKSGFLVPYYGSSNNFGSWINIPYFKVLSKDKDITFNPRIYADKSFLLQNEYRQALKNSNILKFYYS